MSWTCEMVAGEWVSKLDLPDSNRNYYILTDGKEAFLLGSVNSLLTNTTPVGFINGTLYAVRVEEAKVPYRNVTVSINGEPHNFTLFKDVTVTEVYRFDDGCIERVSRCVVTEYSNGTVTKSCEGREINASHIRLPHKGLKGTPVELKGGTLTFTLGERRYALQLPGSINASSANFTAFRARNGVVIVSETPVRLPAGSGIEDAPLIFVPKNGVASPLKISMSLGPLVCKPPGTQTTNSVGLRETHSPPSGSTGRTKTPSGAGNKVCGPGLLVLLGALPLLRRLN
ncbi:hypothetical protein E3E42_01030 [Thermococcus sp. JdF3]|nr:hypothetical protein [Thermococcus sp. JdF3]